MSEEIEGPSKGGDESLTEELGSARTRVLSPTVSLPSRADDPRERAEPAAAVETSTPRQRLGGYVVLGKLGRGGMGTVLEAFDRTLDRRVALKVLHRDLGEEHTKRLLREAQALAKLSHPNVVHVYEVGEADGQAFIAMELVQGRSLRAWLARAPRPGWRECVEVYLQAGEGLAAAHARGLVHRDFKPGNAMIDDAGRVRVLDFGLARRVEDAASVATVASVELSVEEAALEQELTAAGTVMGTPAFMPPEQMRGEEVDARGDQFSYCVALYEALYGERPYAGQAMGALLAAVAGGEVRPVPRGSDVPAALRDVVLRGLAADPRERWPSMEALLAELRRVATPRKRGWLGLAVAGGLVALGLGLAQHAAVGYRCEGARAQLDGVWDETRRRELEAAILGTKVAYAADTWARVEPRLHAYADAWVAAHTEVCEATSVRQEQSAAVMDLRMACLRERRVALREAVGVLTRADATRVEHAVGLVASLPSLSRCDDVEALAAALPQPEDPGVAAQVEALRERLVQARALDEAGAYDELLALTETVVHEAEGLPYLPLQAEALVARSAARLRAARYPEAEQDAERAYVLAVEIGHAGVEALAVARLVGLVGSNQARHDEGLQWAKTALAVARRPHVEPTAEAFALNYVGIVRKDKGDLDAALAHHRRALAIWEAELGPRHPNVGHSLNNIGSVLWVQGKLDEARESFERGLAIREDALGPSHPDVASSLNNIGSVLAAQGKLDEALPRLQRALAIREQSLGPRHPEVAVALNNIGGLLSYQGDSSAALTYFERALAIYEAALGPGHPNVALALTNLGIVLRGQGQLDEALAHLQRAAAIREEVLGPSHPDLAVSLAVLAGTLLAADQPEAARDPAERAIAISATTEAARGVLADARFVLARALWPDPGQRTRARALAQQARDGLAERGEPLAEVDAWLAAHPLP